jgi:hypothetical protein
VDASKAGGRAGLARENSHVDKSSVTVALCRCCIVGAARVTVTCGAARRGIIGAGEAGVVAGSADFIEIVVVVCTGTAGHHFCPML